MYHIKLPVLNKDNDWTTHHLKLNEECKELITAIQILSHIEVEETFKTKEDAAEAVVAEVLDVIQVCVGILDKILKSYPKILVSGALKHIEKLHARGWKFKKWLSVSDD